MKKILYLLGILAIGSNTALAEVDNGGFELWSANSPSGWSLIDGGIALAPSASIKKSGSFSAAVTVNTSDQAATDLRQTVAVTAGQTYPFSVAVYHTEGHVKARLYVNGYQNYSNEALTGQWQTISYNYTAATSGNIEVGLRFYDVSGFDGSEVVYVDDFLPSAASTEPPPASCSANTLSFQLTTDNYGAETSWQLTDSNNQTAYSGGGYSSNSNYSEQWCLVDGSYTFTINDSYGDGICCGQGNGSYRLSMNGSDVFSGGNFSSVQTHSFTLGSSDGGYDLDAYYADAAGLTGYTLKTALHNIIKNHSSQGYGALWTFYSNHELDNYYEQDGSILDIYSENPNGTDAYQYAAVVNQCGSYNSEADCYNREHSFPRSWFGGAVEPMNSDVHHIFATDGYVNAKRSSFPYGKVGTASYTSSNGSKVGTALSSTGYSGTVFEPIDEFKGDIARAYFYMATRYQDRLANWQGNSSEANAALNGTTTQVFESWLLQLLKQWHAQDPVSQKERDRNDAAYQYQGNRNPFVDYPHFVNAIWGN